jgi:hypothetical protein
MRENEGRTLSAPGPLKDSAAASPEHLHARNGGIVVARLIGELRVHVDYIVCREPAQHVGAEQDLVENL